jgi:predicted transport protein
MESLREKVNHERSERHEQKLFAEIDSSGERLPDKKNDNMTLLQGNKRFVESQFKLEDDFEELVRSQSKILFGKDTIFIYTKRKLKGVVLGSTIPDGFLFDLTDLENPEFYLVEIELQKHDFYRHIFPQITKFFGFFRSPSSQNDLVEKLYSIINADAALRSEFKKFLGDREIFKFLKDICEESQNILLVIDGDKIELPEIVNTYTDTWGKLVKILKVKKFTNENEALISVEPDFVDIQYAPDADVGETEEDGIVSSKPIYSEEYHLDGVSEATKQSYLAIKNHIAKNYPEAVFNFQKYYIGIRTDRNLAYLKLQKKKLRSVVMLPEDEVRNLMTNHVVKQLSQGVQGFYNGPCCAVVFENAQDMDDFWKLLKTLIK